MFQLSRLAGGDEPRRGGGGLTPTGTTPDVSTDNINGSEKGEKSLLCMGNPSGPAGHLPYKAEEFCLRTDKLFAATDLTFCYFPWKLTLCHLKASEIHLYGTGGGGGRKKRRLAEHAETQMSANRGRRLSFCRGCGLFPRRDCRGT